MTTYDCKLFGLQVHAGSHLYSTVMYGFTTAQPTAVVLYGVGSQLQCKFDPDFGYFSGVADQRLLHTGCMLH